MRVKRGVENPIQAPIKIWWLLDELKRKKISQKAFSERLGVPIQILTGRASGFPADKVDECMELLENWDGLTKNYEGRWNKDNGALLGSV